MNNLVVNYKRPEWASCPEYGSIFYRPTRNILVHGGRSGGKTTTCCNDLILLLAQKRLRIIVARKFLSVMDNALKQTLLESVNILGLVDFFTFTDKGGVDGINGSAIDFIGLERNDGNIKGLESYDIALIDEAQQISRHSLELLKPTMAKKENSKLIFLMNRENITDPVDVDYIQNQGSHTDVYYINYFDNPFFSKTSEIERKECLRINPNQYEHIWLGKHNTNSEKFVFKNWTIKEFDTHADAMFRLGADWGYSIDPTCAVRCYIMGKTLYIDYEAYKIGCEIIDIPDLFMTIPDSHKWTMCADSARPETISHLNKNGFPKIISASKGKGSIEEGIAWLQSYDIIVHPRCKHTIEELATYSYKVNRQTNEIMPILDDKNNHLIDSLRYATEALRKISKKEIKNVMIPTFKCNW